MVWVNGRLIIAQSCFNLTVETHGVASTGEYSSPNLPRQNGLLKSGMLGQAGD